MDENKFTPEEIKAMHNEGLERMNPEDAELSEKRAQMVDNYIKTIKTSPEDASFPADYCQRAFELNFVEKVLDDSLEQSIDPETITVTIRQVDFEEIKLTVLSDLELALKHAKEQADTEVAEEDKTKPEDWQENVKKLENQITGIQSGNIDVILNRYRNCLDGSLGGMVQLKRQGLDKYRSGYNLYLEFAVNWLNTLKEIKNQKEKEDANITK